MKFSTYAVPMISGEIKRFLRDDGMIKVSRSLKELAYKAYLLKEDLQNQWGREPTVGEISERLGVEQEELVMALDAGGDVESLHKPIYQKDGQEIRLMDKLEEKSEEHEQVLNHIVLTELLGVLNQDEKRLIYLRYFAEQTQSQVGRELGISQVQVSRMEKKILGQNLPHCGSASGNSGRLCVLFWRFWQRARRDGRNAGERRARCTGRCKGTI